MKKLILLSISVFLGLQLAASSSAKAQNFHIVASFGSTHNWGVPTAIMYEVDYFYPYHRFIHVNRFVRGRRVFFNVLLENQGNFIELTFGNGGHIINTNYFNNYPLVSHVCSTYCGYHSDYYFQQQVACQSHYHGGHNHVNYYQQPRYTRHTRPSSVRVVYNNGHGNHHREYRGQNKHHGKNRNFNNQGNDRDRQDYDRPERGNSDRRDFDRRDNDRSSSSSTRTVSRENISRGNSDTRVASSSNGRSSNARTSSNRSSNSARNSSSSRGSRN